MNNTVVKDINRVSELQEYRDFLARLQKMRKEEESSSKSSKKISVTEKRIGINPVSGGIVYGQDNYKDTQKGYTGAVLLSVLVFLFETLFLLIGFLLFK